MKIGDSVGTYKITAEGLSGGFGLVYPAYDELLDRNVAIKALHQHLLQDPARLSAFKNEARTLARLNHPNIATLYNLLEQDDEYFMIMEYVDGPTLHQLLFDCKRMPADYAVKFIYQALTGLAHAHAMRIIHRDIKPSNLMLNSDGVVKIMDFGIARHLGVERNTKTGVLGTVDYMSPEQITAGKIDERSDIYSTGIMLFEMVTGRVPFRGDSEFEILRAHIETPPPPVQTLAPEVPIGIAQCIDIALRKDPTERFPNVTEFSKELVSALAGGTPAAYFRAVTATAEQDTAQAAAAEMKAKADKQPRGPLISNVAKYNIAQFFRKTFAAAVWMGILAAAVIAAPYIWAAISASQLFGWHDHTAIQASHTAGKSNDSGNKSAKRGAKKHSGERINNGSSGYTSNSGSKDPTSAEADKQHPEAKSDTDTAENKDASTNGDTTPPSDETESKDTDKGSDTTKTEDAGKTAENVKSSSGTSEQP